MVELRFANFLMKLGHAAANFYIKLITKLPSNHANLHVHVPYTKLAPAEPFCWCVVGGF